VGGPLAGKRDIMVWNTEEESPSCSGERIEYWLDEELVLVLEDAKSFPSEGMYVTYVNLTGVETTCRVGDVTFILREEREVSNGADLSPGSQPLYLRPTIKIEMQAVP
jgi:hypothetical protein